MNDEDNVFEEDDDMAAGLEAASDASAQPQDGGPDNSLNDMLPYTIKLSRAYSLEGKEISEVDLSGLEDLTTADAEYVERVMAKLRHHPRDKFRDTTYTKHIAMRVTNLPIEFFNGLKWKDQEAITSRIAIYFLY